MNQIESKIRAHFTTYIGDEKIISMLAEYIIAVYKYGDSAWVGQYFENGYLKKIEKNDQKNPFMKVPNANASTLAGGGINILSFLEMAKAIINDNKSGAKQIGGTNEIMEDMLLNEIKQIIESNNRLAILNLYIPPKNGGFEDTIIQFHQVVEQIYKLRKEEENKNAYTYSEVLNPLEEKLDILHQKAKIIYEYSLLNKNQISKVLGEIIDTLSKMDIYYGDFEAYTNVRQIIERQRDRIRYDDRRIHTLGLDLEDDFYKVFDQVNKIHSLVVLNDDFKMIAKGSSSRFYKVINNTEIDISSITTTKRISYTIQYLINKNSTSTGNYELDDLIFDVVNRAIFKIKIGEIISNFIHNLYEHCPNSEFVYNFLARYNFYFTGEIKWKQEIVYEDDSVYESEDGDVKSSWNHDYMGEIVEAFANIIELCDNPTIKYTRTIEYMKTDIFLTDKNKLDDFIESDGILDFAECLSPFLNTIRTSLANYDEQKEEDIVAPQDSEPIEIENVLIEPVSVTAHVDLDKADIAKLYVFNKKEIEYIQLQLKITHKNNKNNKKKYTYILLEYFVKLYVMINGTTDVLIKDRSEFIRLLTEYTHVEDFFSILSSTRIEFSLDFDNLEFIKLLLEYTYLIYLYCDIPIPPQKYHNVNYLGKNVFAITNKTNFEVDNFTIITNTSDASLFKKLLSTIYVLFKRIRHVDLNKQGNNANQIICNTFKKLQVREGKVKNDALLNNSIANSAYQINKDEIDEIVKNIQTLQDKIDNIDINKLSDDANLIENAKIVIQNAKIVIGDSKIVIQKAKIIMENETLIRQDDIRIIERASNMCTIFANYCINVDTGTIPAIADISLGTRRISANIIDLAHTLKLCFEKYIFEDIFNAILNDNCPIIGAGKIKRIRKKIREIFMCNDNRARNAFRIVGKGNTVYVMYKGRETRARDIPKRLTTVSLKG
jgi:hypothetical protein